MSSKGANSRLPFCLLDIGSNLGVQRYVTLTDQSDGWHFLTIGQFRDIPASDPIDWHDCLVFFF